jgi:hypothetical protein
MSQHPRFVTGAKKLVMSSQFVPCEFALGVEAKGTQDATARWAKGLELEKEKGGGCNQGFKAGLIKGGKSQRLDAADALEERRGLRKEELRNIFMLEMPGRRQVG